MKAFKRTPASLGHIIEHITSTLSASQNSTMGDQANHLELDVSSPPCGHLLCAFLAMEPPDVLVSFARECGGGSVGEAVQRFIWNSCIGEAVKNGFCQGPYIKRFLKKLIAAIESDGDVVLDELYEHYAFIMTSSEGDDFPEGKSRVVKKVSFLFPEECAKLLICPESNKLEISLQCSMNMLEGDTGCSIWPSSLYLSEFVLSFPDLFLNKSCLEVGSGVGLLGICLAHVKASSIILSDGDLSTLENMRLNLESNSLSPDMRVSEQHKDHSMCVYLSWESATETELQNYAPDIVLGADVIYDPRYLPHLVRVLSILLKGGTSYPSNSNDLLAGCMKTEVKNADSEFGTKEENGESYGSHYENKVLAVKRSPVAYIASVIRNIDTFNYFLQLAEQANLSVIDITEKDKPFILLPYAKSYQRSNIRIFTISHL